MAAGSTLRRLGDPPRDAGAIQNTLLQLGSQFTGIVFTGALTLFLVRALGASTYGQYALAMSIAALLVLPAGLGLPMAIGRFLADHRTNVDQLRAVLALGMRLQVPAALAATIGLFAAAGPVANAYGDPGLAWPLRWMALSVMGQALFGFFGYAGMSIRQSGIRLKMSIVESATETSASIALVLAGGGAAGAALGKAVGYAVATAAGLYYMARLLGRLRPRVGARLQVGARQVIGYAGATFVVDLGVTAIAQVDILLIGALLTSVEVGNFSAVMRIVSVLGYLGIAVAGGVAPRLSFGGGGPDTRALSRSVRYLLVAQGLALAPMIIWATPITRLLLGAGYKEAPEIMQVLSVMAFMSAPAAVLSMSVTYLGAAQRRVRIVLVTLLLGVISTYVLLKLVGLVGAAIADDVVASAYVLANLWICARLIDVDVWMLARTFGRTVIAASAMATALLLVGTHDLSPVQWLVGAVSGVAAYGAVLFMTGELSGPELGGVAAKVWAETRPSLR